MGIAKLREGIKYRCSECKNDIPSGQGISINKKPYCEYCGEIYLKEFKKRIEKLIKGRRLK